MKDTIFISHATPEDNEFTIWLASRLELLGYKVWIDKKELLGGEVFWKDIEDAIKNKAIKVLLVYSKNILDKSDPAKLKAGIQKEIDFTTQVTTSNPELKDFLILLHLDDAPFNLFKGANDLNQIPFNSNWAEGLELLLKKFQKDTVSKSNSETQNGFSTWYLEHYLIKNPIVKKRELYYSNWWSVEQIPEHFYIYRFENEAQAKAVHEINKDIINTINANCITTFEKDIVTEIIHEGASLVLNPMETHEIKLSDLLLGYEKESFPTKKDAENYFKKLLKRTLHNFFKEKKLFWYELANKNQAYYHTPSSLPTSKISFTYQFRKKLTKKSKKLFGKYLDLGKWHFALSIKPILTPYLGFAVKSHIVFTDNGFKTWEDKALLHSHRRKKGKRMFNEEWRDLLLGFINSLKNENNSINIKLSNNKELEMKSTLETFWSEFGYFDPVDKNRQNIFVYEHDDTDEEEDVILEIDENAH